MPGGATANKHGWYQLKNTTPGSAPFTLSNVVDMTPFGTEIQTLGTHTFRINFVAPPTAGTYNMRWRMARRGAAEDNSDLFFGATTDLPLNVTAITPDEESSQGAAVSSSL